MSQTGFDFSATIANRTRDFTGRGWAFAEIDQWLAGTIYDTMLFNPDFGRLGPRLSPEPELAVFSLDYLNEKATLVGIASVGMMDAAGNVLSQCNTQFILRIVNPVDQARVAESVETVGRDLLRELPALSKGQVIIAGEAVNTPILCRVRARHTRHGAETRDAPADWIRYFELEEQSRRERETALPVQPRRRGTIQKCSGEVAK